MRLLNIAYLVTFVGIATALPTEAEAAESAAELEKRATVASCSASGGANIPVCCKTFRLGDRRTNCRDGMSHDRLSPSHHSTLRGER